MAKLYLAICQFGHLSCTPIFVKKGQLSLIRLYETILDSPVVVNYIFILQGGAYKNLPIDIYKNLHLDTYKKGSYRFL